MHQAVSRRRFLKQTAFGAFALSAGRVVPTFARSYRLPGRVEEQLQFFSPKEYLIIKAIADRIVGRPNGPGPLAEQIGVAERADKFLAGADPEIQGQFHQLLTVFNAPLFAFLFDFRFSSFLSMNAEDQASYLDDWMTSPFSFRRTAFQALKRTTLSMFYTDQGSWNEIGYTGMDVPAN